LVTPFSSATARILSRSPPGSVTAPRMVFSHQMTVLFCANGVTGMMAAFMALS
jgi:hypothetical protein